MPASIVQKTVTSSVPERGSGAEGTDSKDAIQWQWSTASARIPANSRRTLAAMCVFAGHAQGLMLTHRCVAACQLIATGATPHLDPA